MKNSDIANTNTIKENLKMKKYIVEVKEPKNGQVVSTGGVRKNGKMESQFKNPVPYEEPKLTPVVGKADIVSTAKVSSYTMKDRIKNEAEELAVDVGRDLVSMLWCDFAKPFLKAKLNQTLDRLLTSPQTNSQEHLHDTKVDSKAVIIDDEAEELTPVNNSSDKIIQFSKKYVG